MMSVITTSGIAAADMRWRLQSLQR